MKWEIFRGEVSSACEVYELTDGSFGLRIASRYESCEAFGNPDDWDHIDSWPTRTIPDQAARKFREGMKCLFVPIHDEDVWDIAEVIIDSGIFIADGFVAGRFFVTEDAAQEWLRQNPRGPMVVSMEVVFV